IAPPVRRLAPPTGPVPRPPPAVFLRPGRAEEPERAHLAHDGGVEALLAVVEQHAGKELVLRIAARGRAHHALLLGELAFEIERVLPVERGFLLARLLRGRL